MLTINLTPGENPEEQGESSSVDLTFTKLATGVLVQNVLTGEPHAFSIDDINELLKTPVKDTAQLITKLVKAGKNVRMLIHVGESHLAGFNITPTIISGRKQSPRIIIANALGDMFGTKLNPQDSKVRTAMDTILNVLSYYEGGGAGQIFVGPTGGGPGWVHKGPGPEDIGGKGHFEEKDKTRRDIINDEEGKHEY